MRPILLATLALLYSQCAMAQVISREEAYAELKPTKPSKARLDKPDGLTGRLVTGYQGWFRAPGDGSGLGFSHYTSAGRFEPGKCSIDVWPDLTEFADDEKFPTAFRHADGSVASVFSSLHPKTVDRHFGWMQQYEIDGAFVQRFAVHGAKHHRDHRRLKFENRKLLLCRDAAIRHGRCYVLMYDLSGITDQDFDLLADDWKQLRKRMQLGSDPNDSAYLQLNGKPLVAIWGVGFNDNRKYSLERCEWFIRLLKHNPEWGGMSIMLGVPYHWREQTGDADPNPKLHDVIRLADVISPWSVGRYGNPEDIVQKVVPQQLEDRRWCKRNNIQYLPVLFPGFSWKNMYEGKQLGIPRLGGKFFWQQFNATLASGGQSAYIAMFDEIDEGTAIFKCTNDPPVGLSKFVTFEGKPSDHYLWLCQQGRRHLRGELPPRPAHAAGGDQ